MRILYVTQWFEPEPAFKGADFVEKLAANGHEVEVVTGFPNYPGGKIYPGYRLRPYLCERSSTGLRVHRLFLYPSHDRSSFGRMLNYISFFLSCAVFGLLRAWKFDAVYVYHPPITPALAMAFATKLYRVRLVIDIQDLWPDSVAASGMASARIARVLDLACRFVYRAADHIVVQAEGMRRRLIERGVPEDKLTRIYNWATYAPGEGEAEVPPPAEFSDRINVVYGGNIGQAQALSYVIGAMKLARAEVPALHLHIFGDGIERDLLNQRAGADTEADTVLHGPVGRRQMDRIFDMADILVLHLKDDPLYGFTIPSKTQHYLAVGKPIVAGLRGEAAAILAESGAAMVFEPENSALLAGGLIHFGKMDTRERAEVGRRGRDHYWQHFGMEAALDRTLAILAPEEGDDVPDRWSPANIEPWRKS